ncbi:leucine-rich repeat-containing protein 1 isoform X2 [Orussus abietinus]|uniref:leucine-rich repeat-containing protein 1 isoform X2 n=1 Tax=Orussus abietinus TaxID=222816 RepID=UPI00062519B1|nr:leucine-rich repeat-containing protein 1 isoform X2 [Orussus abietinus]
MGSAWWQCAACLRAQEEDICELQLNHCNLYDVPPDVFIYERTLEKLYLDANRIKDLPRPLFQCHELRVLSLSDNEVSTLPPAIASLINLEYLDLSKNSIKELPDSMKECKNLRFIDISVNPFERFPDAITHIVGLRELYINDAYIEYLPANFGRLSALKTLELRENNMMTLPKSMSRLVNLQRLDIGNNDFTELPEVVGDLINLTELWIDGNDIRRIPVNIEQLFRLNHFDCTMNAIHTVPSEIQGWRDISIMNFSSNEIYQLPDSICYLHTMVTLKVDDNQLNALPEEIGQMSSLEELIVTKNFLEYLPSSIGLLRKLHCLNADNNYLRCLPPEIGSCTSLSLLSLRSNNLTHIPPELGHLSSLRVLNLVNNCIKYLPVSMLNLTNLKALWLSDNQSQPLVPLQQEFNHEEDIMVLSCFMLPQKPRQDFEQIEPVGPVSTSIIGTGRKICFAAEVESEVPRQLHRAPTPYPKELRNLARHARNLHHQSTHDQREGTIKEAVVAKATASLGIVSKPEPVTLNNKAVEHADSEESTEEPAKIILAKEKNPDIREAKCVRNPTSEYLTKQPTIADYVNSTWKPDEYSKANTAKIVESEKLAEPYRSMNSSDGKGAEITGSLPYKINETPLSPPPYHIAAAFSKQAALFQQLNHAPTPENHSPVPATANNISNSEEESLRHAQTAPPQPLSPDLGSKGSPEASNGNDSETRSNESFSPDDRHYLDKSHDQLSRDTADSFQTPPSELRYPDSPIDRDRSPKPSKIPVLRSKHSDGSAFENESENCTETPEESERPKTLRASCIPTSPITGKKYRSPLTSQSRSSDRSKRSLLNGSSIDGSLDNSFKSCDSNVSTPTSIAKDPRDGIKNKQSDDGLLTLAPKNSRSANEADSGRSTPASPSAKQLDVPGTGKEESWTRLQYRRWSSRG